MDKKKKMSWRTRRLSFPALHKMVLAISATLATLTLQAQDVKVQFCDYNYEYGLGKDSVTLYFNFLDKDNKHVKDIKDAELEKKFYIEANGKKVRAADMKVMPLKLGEQRVPQGFTFSIVVDRGLSPEGKNMVYEAMEKLVMNAPDSCVYLSFFGNEVTSSQLISKNNIGEFKGEFDATSSDKCFYSAVYAKLAEFCPDYASLKDKVRKQEGYVMNEAIAYRANKNKDKNILLLFIDGAKDADYESGGLNYLDFYNFQNDTTHFVPKVYAFYHLPGGVKMEDDSDVAETLKAICQPRASLKPGEEVGALIVDRQGKYMPVGQIDKMFDELNKLMEDWMYDYALVYKVSEDESYSGNTSFEAFWQDSSAGKADFAIGSEELPWPQKEVTLGEQLSKYLWALLLAALAFVVFFLIVKVLIPYIKSKRFEVKYYKPYVQEPNVKRRICSGCRGEIKPGQMVVTKCKHIMHVGCWKQGGYHCGEYGQHCVSGIQEHVDMNHLFTKTSFKDCFQTLSGIGAGLVGWVLYDLIFVLTKCDAPFKGLAKGIANIVLRGEQWMQPNGEPIGIFTNCVGKVAAFLAIGLLLGFFLSFVFRYNDEYREKDWKVMLRIIGLSLLSALIGMAAFAIGGLILCLLVSATGATSIPWYFSLPAYILFSICMTASLAIKSSIPLKNALIGGLCSAVIGFFVLYFSKFTKTGWMPMLLNFIIYGGGLGASLVTVRMLAEKYFLVVLNGVREGLKIPIHKWMQVGNRVSIGMAGDCEIQMNWEKSNKVAKEHALLFIDPERFLPVLKPMAAGINYTMRAELATNKEQVLSNGDTFRIGDTTFQYVENE